MLSQPYRRPCGHRNMASDADGSVRIHVIVPVYLPIGFSGEYGVGN